jgi:hypothetical protein
VTRLRPGYSLFNFDVSRTKSRDPLHSSRKIGTQQKDIIVVVEKKKGRCSESKDWNCQVIDELDVHHSLMMPTFTARSSR